MPRQSSPIRIFGALAEGGFSCGYPGEFETQIKRIKEMTSPFGFIFMKKPQAK
jgi:hypothetical protein